ncbi:MAG: hypothetical protein KGD73_14015, partial [Candidatus Lokiarchaeota archaeon]|nr:hypothetical protein [Candidatus Lokiarchaeota archaeon]
MSVKNGIKTFVVIGAGTMGREIAQVALMGGFQNVILHDIKVEMINDASSYIQSGLKKLESKGLLKDDQKTNDLMVHLIK